MLFAIGFIAGFHVFYEPIPPFIKVSVTIDQDAEIQGNLIATVIAEADRLNNPDSIIKQNRQPHSVVFYGDDSAPVNYTVIFRRTGEKNNQHNGISFGPGKNYYRMEMEKVIYNLKNDGRQATR